MPFRPLAFLLVLLLGTLDTSAQSDSLWKVWRNTALPDSARLKAIGALSWKAVFEKPDSGIVLAGMQLDLARKSGDRKALFTAYNTLAVGHKMHSDLNEALADFQQCLAVAKEMNDRGRMANTFSNMSTVYKDLGDQPKALDLLQQSLRIDQELGNKEGMAGTFNNIGNTYKRLGDFKKALTNYEQSATLFDEVGNAKGRAGALVSIGTMHNELGDRPKAVEELLLAISLYEKLNSKLDLGKARNNLGQVYGKLGRTREAFEQFLAAQKIFTQLDAKDPLARSYFYQGDVLLSEGRANDAILACRKGLSIAEELNLLAQRKECSDCLMRAYALTGDFHKAFDAQHVFIQLDDSLDKLNDSKEVTRLELTRAFQERQIADSLAQARERFARELDYEKSVTKEKNRRNVLFFTGVVLVVLAAGLIGRLRYTDRAKKIIEKERDRSDELLHNILPEEVAAELKEKGHADARLIDHVTVLFTDFKGFTAMSEKLSPKELVKDIHECFSAFDHIMEKHGIEKIKTIGDAYMAAGGLPTPNTTHALDVVKAAFEIRDFIAEGKARKLAMGLPYFEIRIGIHTGPVVAGIVGVKKFAYDIWGDTVNTASRMESSGEPGRVNISSATYELVRNTPGLRFEPRGRIEAKNKGTLEMYFVN